MQRQIKPGQVWKYSTPNEPPGNVLEWIFVIVEYFGLDYKTSSNVRVMLLDGPSSSYDAVGSQQYYLIDDMNYQWQLVHDV